MRSIFHRQFIKNRQLRNKLPLSYPATNNKVKNINFITTERINCVVQILLFLLACYGYIYVVQPLYSKAVLEEDIAKLKLESEVIEKDLTLSKENLIESKKEVAQSKHKLLISTSQLKNSHDLVLAKEVDMKILEEKLLTNQAELESIYLKTKNSVYVNFKIQSSECVYRNIDQITFGKPEPDVTPESLYNSFDTCFRTISQNFIHNELFHLLKLSDQEKFISNTEKIPSKLHESFLKFTANLIRINDMYSSKQLEYYDAKLRGLSTTNDLKIQAEHYDVAFYFDRKDYIDSLTSEMGKL